MAVEHRKTVSLVVDPSDTSCASEPVRWAIDELRAALAARGVAVAPATRPGDASGEPTVVIAGGSSAVAQSALRAAGVSLPDAPEALALLPAVVHGKLVALACGSDARGLVYAVLELADRVTHGQDPVEPLRQLLQASPVVERPANVVRGLMRLFTSDVEDRGWYHDREFWSRYLTMAATDRYNRFQLALGIGYDFARRMRDSYFYFTYPFLLAVPGYDVRAVGISDAERERNLETLQFIAREAKRRGLQFQLGLWAQVYEFAESPEVNHPIEGLDAERHAAYCRDAVRALLQAAPEIDGLTLRVHGESGIPEGSYDFWGTLFSGIAECGRRVEIDMHAKGIDARMIDLALATGQPVTVSPKFWAEHMGLPYHQAEIRAVEQPGPATGQHARLMALSTGERRFTRYGYADLLPEDRRYDVLFRVWPGTHRLLLWGDTVTGRSYGRAFQFCGAQGAELFEPLSFSGRRGSGLPDGRNAYADPSLRPDRAHAEWEKYRYTYRLWGRLLYNPDADPETWRRLLEHTFGPAAEAAEAALSSASRILPLITTAHLPSAANNAFWPEVPTNMPIVDESRPHPFGDTPRPRRFGTVSALDPELFASVEDAVEERLSGTRSGRYSPLDVARWLEELAGVAAARLEEAARLVPNSSSPAFRRWTVDVRIEAALGRFFAGKLRAATGHAFYARTGDAASLSDAVAFYREARDAWAEAAAQAGELYKPDLTFGPEPHLRGHWADRIAAIEQDMKDLEGLLEQPGPPSPGFPPPPEGGWLRSALEERRPQAGLRHTPPVSFTPGAALTIEADAPSGVAGISLRYRHVNQAERWREVAMAQDRSAAAGGRWRAVIPGEFTESLFPLQYLFVLRIAVGVAWLWPGLGDELADTPYFVVRHVAPVSWILLANC